METKLKFRDQLAEYVEKTLETQMGKLSPIQLAKAMTRFYMRKIQGVITPGLVPADEDDLEQSIIDGSGDCGVDYISRSEGRVLIVQAKHRGQHKHEKLSEFIHFCEVLQRIHPITGTEYKKNQKLREALSDIDWENDYFILQYITLGRVGPDIRQRAEEGPSLSSRLEDLEDRCDLSLSDETELNVRLREAVSAGEMVPVPIDLRFVADDSDEPWIKLETGRKRSTYLGFVRGSDIAELYRPNRFRLFAMNIRDWVGDTSTNKGIVSTAQHRPEDFLFFNNGISAVATSIEEDRERKILRCKNFSIINGAQTVRSLFKAQSKNAQAVRDTTLMLRISTFSLGKEPSFLEEITRYNNTQNKIAVSDFRSNDPVQKDLAVRFSELKRDGMRFWYKNKRSREQRDKIPIEMEEFAKTVHAFKFGPHDMWGGTAKLFDTGKDGRYAWVFGDGQSTWEKMPDSEFGVLSAIWFVCEEIRRLWKDEKGRRPKEEAAGLSLERRYVVYFAVGELLRLIYVREGQNLEEDLRKLASPKWTEKDGSEKMAIRELTQLAFTGLVKAYQTAATAPEFRHRNWFRDRNYAEGIRLELRFIRDIKERLPLLLGENSP